MKISKSKQELARIISENGGWKDQKAEWSAQDGGGGQVSFFKKEKPTYIKTEKEWMAFGESIHCYGSRIEGCEVIKNFHQTILSRVEYLHLYPATDSDGWIEWNGGECPVDGDSVIDVKLSDGDEFFGVDADWDWHQGSGCDIIAYRLHKPNLAETEFCESVMRSIPEPESKPTIEQLAADYRNAKDYTERKQEEADAAKAAADEALRKLELAGEAIGLVVTPITAKQEPELVITDWRDLQVGDIIEYVDGSIKDKIGMTGPVVEFAPDATDGMMVRMKCDNGPRKGRLGWPMKWRFIRRP